MSTSIPTVITTGDILIQCGIYPSIAGFHYLEEAVDLINNHNAPVATVEMYQILAKHLQDNSQKIKRKGILKPSSVERAIRHAVTEIACSAQTPMFKEIIGNINSFKGNVTNSQFIYALARYCKVRGIEATSTQSQSQTRLKSEAIRHRQAKIREQYIDMLLSREFPEYRRALDACIDE